LTEGTTTLPTHQNGSFSSRFWFRNWPNELVPLNVAGVYAVWHETTLIYGGMSGREIEKNRHKKKYGLYNRLTAHASGRLSGDQFCVYVANRLVIPTLQPNILESFASGAMTLDKLTREYIHDHFEYQWCVLDTSKEAYEVELKLRNGTLFGKSPLLNGIG
jgi:hypothetical protein